MKRRVDEAREVLDQWRAQQAARPPSLFDPIARAEKNAPGPLWSTATECLDELIRGGRSFTVDDLRDRLEERLPGWQTYDLRSLGALLQRAARRGLIARCGYVPSTRRHGSPIVAWLPKETSR